MTITNIKKDETIYYTKCTCTYCNCSFEAEGNYTEIVIERIYCPNCDFFSGILRGHIKKRKQKKGNKENVK